MRCACDPPCSLTPFFHKSLSSFALLQGLLTHQILSHCHDLWENIVVRIYVARLPSRAYYGKDQDMLGVGVHASQ